MFAMQKGVFEARYANSGDPDHPASSDPCFISIYFMHVTKTRLYNIDPLQPYFYIVKLVFTGVHIIFLILLKTIDCGYPLEPPRRGGSNAHPQTML